MLCSLWQTLLYSLEKVGLKKQLTSQYYYKSSFDSVDPLRVSWGSSVILRLYFKNYCPQWSMNRIQEIWALRGKKYYVFIFSNFQQNHIISFHVHCRHSPQLLSLLPVKITDIFITYQVIADILKYQLCS